ncbi:MAG: hypothetical protein EOP34_07495, partial [Rickettsiales bacterium]
MYYTNNIYTHILLKKKAVKYNNSFKGSVFNYTKSLIRKALSAMFALFNLSKHKAIGTITIIINLMPQLVPFYFINQVTFAFAIIAL